MDCTSLENLCNWNITRSLDHGMGGGSNEGLPESSRADRPPHMLQGFATSDLV
jgi:hypothetical protein